MQATSLNRNNEQEAANMQTECNNDKKKKRNSRQNETKTQQILYKDLKP